MRHIPVSICHHLTHQWHSIGGHCIDFCCHSLTVARCASICFSCWSNFFWASSFFAFPCFFFSLSSFFASLLLSSTLTDNLSTFLVTLLTLFEFSEIASESTHTHRIGGWRGGEQEAGVMERGSRWIRRWIPVSRPCTYVWVLMDEVLEVRIKGNRHRYRVTRYWDTMPGLQPQGGFIAKQARFCILQKQPRERTLSETHPYTCPIPAEWHFSPLERQRGSRGVRTPTSSHHPNHTGHRSIGSNPSNKGGRNQG